MPRYVLVLVIMGALVFSIVVGHLHHSTPSVPQKPVFTCKITSFNACVGLPHTGSYHYPAGDVPEVTIPG